MDQIQQYLIITQGNEVNVRKTCPDNYLTPYTFLYRIWTFLSDKFDSRLMSDTCREHWGMQNMFIILGMYYDSGGRRNIRLNTLS